MRIERFQERIVTFVVVTFGLLFAVYCGKQAGSGNYKMIGLLAQVFGLIAICLGMRNRVWLFIPLCWPLTGKIPILEIPFSVRDWAVLLIFGCFVVLYLLKMYRDRAKFDLIDVLIGLSLLNLVTVFVRNPVGADWLGSQLVGGKPYFNIFIAGLAFLIIARSPITPSLAHKLPIISIVGALLVGIGSIVVAVAPEAAGYLGMFYSSFAPDTTAVVVEEAEVERMFPLAMGGLSLALLLASRFDPISLISPRHLLRGMLMALALIAILLSGFRSFLLAAGVYVAMSAIFRKRYRDLVALGALAILFVTFLAIGNNRFFTLPLAAQRALSFLPGRWDYVAVADARGSTEWRWEIWRMALFEEGWIKDKLLGDGFGFTKHQLSIMTSREGFLGAGNQEAFLVAGNYHSGPISTIRYVGVVGLVLFVPLLGLLVVRYCRVIKRSRDTPYLTIALFVGLPIVWLPVPWVFIAGNFDSGFIEVLYAAGFLKLLERGLDTYESSWGEGAKMIEASEIRPLRVNEVPVLRRGAESN